MSPNLQDEYFSDGLTEEIITNLAHLQSLRVISRTTSMALKGTSKDIITIGQELKVEYVLEGSVRKSESKIRITAQLIKATTDEHLWAEKFDGTMDDIFDFQEQIAKRIVDALKIKITPEEKKRFADRPIIDPKAYDMWILSKSFFRKLTKEGIERGIQLIKSAIEIEEDNAKLYAALGDMYWAAYDIGIMHTTEIFDLMEQCVSKSLSLDPNQAEALSIKGLILYKKGNLPDYIRYTLPSVELGFDNAGQLIISFVLAELGKLTEAHYYSVKATTTNPLDFLSWFVNGFVDLIDGNASKALNSIREARDRLAPGEPFAGWWVAQIYAYSGENESAYNEFKKVALSDSSPWNELCRLFQLALESNRIGVIEHINKSGISDFSKTDEYYPLFIANALALVGDYDEALVWLKRSIDWGFSNYVFLSEYNRFLEPLRDDLRFQALIEQARNQQESFML
jgi:TolB-like protein/tetratricopeptide (TPR) repeat protein